MTSSGQISPGAEIGGFVVGDVLGEGGFGTVYRARSADGETVAIKVFKRDRTDQWARLSNEHNEIEALLRLHHPSLVRLRNYGYLPQGGLWLVMELAEGEPLNRYLRSHGRLDTIEAIRIVRKLAEALAHCHDLNIAHLDLKPPNIILVDPQEPRIKVLDFGLAYIEGSWKPADSGVRAGTIAYMAPEVLAHPQPPSFNPRIDLHALGIIFYELLAGRLPFEFSNAAELIARKQAGEIVPLRGVAPDVPEAVDRLVRHLLARDPIDRPGSATWLVSCLQDLYFVTLGGGEPVLASAPPTVVTPESVPLLGRQKELDRLRSAFEATRRGEGRAVLLVGEAGLGKSRLVSEFLDEETVSSAAIIGYGRCRGLRGLAPYSALRDGLGQLVRGVLDVRGTSGDELRKATALGGGDDAALLCSLVPELQPLVREPEAEEQNTARLMSAPHVGRAIRRLLTATGACRPLILVLEDLDHADEGTLSVTTQLVEKAPPGVLVLGTSRSAEPLPADAPPERMVLMPFDRMTNREHLGRLLPGANDKVLARLEHSLPILSAGNPLFNMQVLRNLEKEGYLARTGAGTFVLAAEAASEYTPPESVSAALGRTLERLNPDVLEILAVAALFGHQFAVSDVIGLALFPAERVQHAVAEAVRHYLCRQDGEIHVFVHESIREHLGTVTERVRLPELHARIARVLHASGAPAAALAYHLERAGSAIEASRLYLEAGLEYDALHDPTGACRHLQQALDLLAQLPQSDDRNALLVRTAHELSRIGCLAGDPALTLAGLRRCDALLHDSDPDSTVALKAAFARVFYAQGDFPNAVTYSRECLNLIKEHPGASSYACVPTNIMGRVLIASGRPKAALALLTTGCDLARAAGEHVELAHSEGVLSVALAHLGEYDRAEQRVASCATLAARLGDPLRMAGAYFYQAVLAEARFDWDMGVKFTTRLLSYAHEHGIGGLYLLMGTMFAGRHQFHLGRLHRARVLLLNALNLSRVVGISMGVGWAHAFLGDVHLVAGRRDDASDWYRKGLDVGNAGGRDEYAAGMSLIGLAQCAAGAAQAEAARALADEAVSRLREAGLIAILAHALQRYAEIMNELGDMHAAVRLRAEERAVFSRLGVAPCAWRPQILDERGSTVLQSMDRTTSAGSDEVERLDQSLIETLSTIDGFVPGFAHPEPRM